MEERARPCAAHVTSGDTYGQGYQAVQRLVPAKPSTSRGTGCVDEVLDYDDGDDPEEIEIVQQKGVHKGFKDRSKADEGRSFCVFQETTRKAVRSDHRVGESRNTITAGNLPQGAVRKVGGVLACSERREDTVRYIMQQIDLGLSAVAISGCVADPNGACSVWIVGHCFVHWVEKQASARHFGRQFSLYRARINISRVGKSGMRWRELLCVLIED
ncbi:hypothetical protein NDU88_001877 [Pleurodeles waltl]|uniref:Uncharacterized protein n=1 Tax=Pleurodeles waltl TaxID=8319 RepID=A0AAV7LAV9_PLEWA|nr:hypothetical protein NDU88_001877 [Pleurodeles waltl]